MSYVLKLRSSYSGTDQQQDDAAFADVTDLLDRVHTVKPGRTITVDYPSDQNITRGLLPQNRGYAINVTGAESVLTPTEDAAKVDALPDDGARGWGDVDLSGGGV